MNTPTLIIRFSDLEKNRVFIEDKADGLNIIKAPKVGIDKEDLEMLCKKLKSSLADKIEFPELQLAMLRPLELYVTYTKMEKLLTKLKIDYRAIY